MCICIIRNILELTYDLKKLLTVTSYYFLFHFYFIKRMALRYIKFVFCFLFLKWKTNGRLGTRIVCLLFIFAIHSSIPRFKLL